MTLSAFQPPGPCSEAAKSVIDIIKQPLKELNSTSHKSIQSAILQSMPDRVIDLKENYLTCSLDSVAVAVCVGPNDGLYKRLFHSLGLYNSGRISELVIVSISSKECWWSNQEGRIRNGKDMDGNDGNRQNWGKIREAIAHYEGFVAIPVVPLILERYISATRHREFEW